MLVTNSKHIKAVEIILYSSSFSFFFSATYFTIPLEKPKVDMLSNDDEKLRRFPTKAIPFGPTKTANTFDVINPIPIFNNMLKLFKEVILNKLVLIILL